MYHNVYKSTTRTPHNHLPSSIVEHIVSAHNIDTNLNQNTVQTSNPSITKDTVDKVLPLIKCVLLSQKSQSKIDPDYGLSYAPNNLILRKTRKISTKYISSSHQPTTSTTKIKIHQHFRLTIQLTLWIRYHRLVSHPN